MDGNYVSMEFHNEYAKRIEDEYKRQNKRLDNLEKAIEENRELSLSIERLTVSVQSMVEEQKAQGKRLESLENRDGEMWRKIVGYVITTIVGILIGYIAKHFGI